MRGSLPDGLDSIHNYFESLVLKELRRRFPDISANSDYIADIACITLNHLPPRYVRHDVDMAFYLSDEDLEAMIKQVMDEVPRSIAFVDKHRGKADK